MRRNAFLRTLRTAVPRRAVTALWCIGILFWSQGCASTARIEEESGHGYEKKVSPFVVESESGTPFSMPFLGGFNVPRPQAKDIDADGDLDLFVQEESGSVMFFENTGSSTTPHFEWRTDRYGNLDVGEWYRMLDLDEDGDIDILAEQRFSHIRYFRNDGTAQEARFVLAVDSLKDADGTFMFADRQNIPNLTDIDCDGLIDLFIGRITGTITRYESVGLDEAGVPRFRFVTDNFEEIEIIGQIQTRHGANTMEFGDLDADGDQDLLWGDFFEPGLLYIRNLGSCGLPSMRGEPEPFPGNEPVRTSGYNAPIMADIDEDGDLDILFGVLGGAFNANATTADNFYFLEQQKNGAFREVSRRYLNTVDIGSESIVRFVDLDGDGDADMLLSNKIQPEDQNTSGVFYYENTGSAEAPRFRARGAMDLATTYHQNPVFADLDADGDLDMLLGKWNREIAYFRNDGSANSPEFVEVDQAYLTLTRGSNSFPALADLDADGDVDLIVGEASGTLNFYRNNGTSREPAFELVSDEFGGIDVGRRSAPVLVDIDGDADFDLVVGSELDGFRLFRNDGSANEFEFVDAGALDLALPVLATPEFVDIDGDGDLDVFSGSVSGGVVFYENNAH